MTVASRVKDLLHRGNKEFNATFAYSGTTGPVTLISYLSYFLFTQFVKSYLILRWYQVFCSKKSFRIATWIDWVCTACQFFVRWPRALEYLWLSRQPKFLSRQSSTLVRPKAIRSSRRFITPPPSPIVESYCF